jgi:hypothetical protein
MRTDAELETLAQQLRNLLDSPHGEVAQQFFKVCNDLTSEELARFANVCKRLLEDRLKTKEKAMKVSRQRKS